MHLPAISPAIKLLLATNVVVFVANALLVGRLSDPGSGAGGFWFAFSWAGLWEGYGLGLLRLVTYQITHSFRDPLHLLMNMLVLYFFGTMAEARLGYRGVLRLYLFGGIAGALLHLVVAGLQGHADVPLVGASGACYGFLLYAACMAPQSTVYLLFVPVPLWGVAALLVGLGLYSTFVDFATGFPGGVSHGAHLGGAAAGWLAFRFGWFRDFAPHGHGIGWFASLRRGIQDRRRAASARAAQKDQQELDAVLAKVKEQGIASLTAAERRCLERASERARHGGS